LRQALVFALGSAAALACATETPAPHRSLRALWGQYREMPEVRALAIAGDPDNVWLGGVTGGHPTRAAAESAALAECGRRRVLRRIQAKCRLYAVNDEIVWKAW
jgi:hypothetical protein